MFSLRASCCNEPTRGFSWIWRCEMWIDILPSTALSASPDWNLLVTQMLESANHCQCQQILTQCFLPKPCCPHRTTLLVLITCWIFNVSWQFFSARQFGILIHSILLFDTGLCTCLYLSLLWWVALPACPELATDAHNSVTYTVSGA